MPSLYFASVRCTVDTIRLNGCLTYGIYHAFCVYGNVVQGFVDWQCNNDRFTNRVHQKARACEHMSREWTGYTVWYMKGPRYQATLLPRPPNKPLPRPAPPGPEAGPPVAGTCSSIVRARLAIPNGGGDDLGCCNWGGPTGPGPIPMPAPLPLLLVGGARQDALTNTPAPRPVSVPVAVLGVTEVDAVAVIIAWGAFGGVSVCRRLGVAASPSTLGSSRKPSVNGLAVSAPELAHAEEPAAGG